MWDLNPLFLLEKDVQGPVALVEGRWPDTVGEHDVVEPLEDRPALGGRSDQAVGEHDEHGVGEVLRARASPIKENSSSRLSREQQASAAAAPPSLGAPLATSEAESIRLPVAWLESAAMTWASCPEAAKVADLAKAEQLLMGVLPVDAHVFDQRETRTAPVAPIRRTVVFTNTPIASGHRAPNVADMSPLHQPTDTRPLEQEDLLRTLRTSKKRRESPNSGPPNLRSPTKARRRNKPPGHGLTGRHRGRLTAEVQSDR